MLESFRFAGTRLSVATEADEYIGPVSQWWLEKVQYIFNNYSTVEYTIIF